VVGVFQTDLILQCAVGL